ncbi:Fucolectin [Stylophora pistillata]|uniref:Fucolectin n=1 Tax=Stylophora pistillata TaxID=50429 RepID=A0A2B4T063_STYPI|nr:Fucolectin [Stylophora pistillata]
MDAKMNATSNYASLWIFLHVGDHGITPPSFHGPGVPNCFSNPVGVASPNIIPDEQMTASSQFSPYCGAAYGRLNGNRGNGNSKGDQWVKKYTMQSSKDGTTWKDYQEAEILKKNTNPWWRVDLEEVLPVSEVFLPTGGDCCGGTLNGAEIRVARQSDYNTNVESNENNVEHEAKRKDAKTQTDLVESKDACIQTDQSVAALVKQYEMTIEGLQREIESISKKNECLKSRLFSIERFRADKSAVSFYTSFPNNAVLMEIYNYLDPGEKGENIRYYVYSKSEVQPEIYNQETEIKETKKGRPRHLRPIDEYFLVLCRLRQDFKAKYKSTRVIIDCTEVRCQLPSSLQLNGELFSSYKNHTTLKGLVGISPSGAVTFVSQLYTGSISDREIVYRSGFLDLPFDEGDSVIADKGFTVEDLLPLGVKLNIPPFLGSSKQMPAEEVIQTQEIASLRIHVERVINKIKNFHIWDGVVPLNQLGLVNQMWTVCALLCNANPSVISVVTL